jgi:hypothetical protein
VGYRRKVFDIAGMTNENKALALTPQEFAQMGAGAVAYVKAINSEDAQRLFPQAQQLPHGVKLLALIGADGSPLMLTASKDAAIANAWEHELKTVSLH